eukprot:6458504-Amphidinium_carterae.1
MIYAVSNVTSLRRPSCGSSHLLYQAFREYLLGLPGLGLTGVDSAQAQLAVNDCLMLSPMLHLWGRSSGDCYQHVGTMLSRHHMGH